jgi:putative flippase GtrA
MVRSLGLRLARPLRFGAVGLSGLAVNTLALWLLAARGGVPVWLAGALATEAAILWNFLLNDRWTFRGVTDCPPLRRLLRYNGVALGGMAISVALLSLLTSVGAPLLSANLVAVGAATGWNYLANARWTWGARGAGRMDHV